MPSTPRAWAAGRSWQWRLPLFLLLVYQASIPLREMRGHLFAGITFGAHEFGHLFFAFFGQWMTIAGGSLMQVLVPIGAAAAVWRARDWFGVAVCALFLAASLGDLSWYIGDARAQDLDLVSFSPDGGGHDWHYLLARAGLLKQDLALARLTRFVGWLLILGATVFTARLSWWMATERAPSASDSVDAPAESPNT